MILRDIHLHPELSEFPTEVTSRFRFQTRYLCNFLERDVLKGLKFKTNGFDRICVIGSAFPQEGCLVNSCHVVGVQVGMDIARYRSLSGQELHEFFIGMLLEGLEKCARHHRIPLSEIKSAIDDFRAGGYRNEWTFKKRTFRPVGLQASLNCSLDMEKFILTLKLERKGVVVYDAPILETKPDEIMFAYRFKDVVLDGQTVVVKNKFGKPTFSLELNSLT